MDIPTDLSSYHKYLSFRLFTALDKIGASEKMRKLRTETATTVETLFNLGGILHRRPYTQYGFGSSVEGTTTPGMNSDIDILACYHDWDVVEDLTNVSSDKDCCKRLFLLLIRDESTHPGYFKLQFVKDGIPLTDKIEPIKEIPRISITFDCHKRIVLTKRNYFSYVNFDAVHGPADTTYSEDGCPSYDHVQAQRLHTWQTVGTPWLVRKRRHNWPSDEIIKQLKSYEAFLVSVGHPNSHEKDKEWRISFSLQERYLMLHLNPTQFKCYVLLKLI